MEAHGDTAFLANQVKVSHLIEIGEALSSERDLNQLLELIFNSARELTGADAGSLYLPNADLTRLEFQIVQNRSLNIRMGGSGRPITWPAIPILLPDGRPNVANVCAACGHSGNAISIADVYHADGYDFSGTRRFDEETGYRSQSMIVVPMHDHENRLAGVLQLINAKNGTGTTIPFSQEDLQLTQALASQAALAINNVTLLTELRDLFHAFIRSIVGAIDAKSQYTGGHIERVTQLTMMLAQRINASEAGPFRDVRFTDAELTEIEVAAWLHDIGKIVTPEAIMNKSRKLEGLRDGIHDVRLRYELLKRDGAGSPEALDEEYEFLARLNEGREFTTDEDLARLESIAKRRVRIGGQEVPLLSEDELECLRVQKGTLTTAERQIIEDHVRHTIQMLEPLPFPRDLASAPEIAGGHHEKLNGTGYPKGLKGDELSLKARILAVADVFDALTADDRPYKKAMSVPKAIEILRTMVDHGELDGRVVDLLANDGADA